MIGFILNVPYTIIGLIIGLISFPKKISFLSQSPHAIILSVGKLWWTFSYGKNARGATIGHVVLLGPNVEGKDLKHELVHVEQHRKMPIIFPIFYFWEIFKKGYRKNKYEIEAYQIAGNVCRLGE